MRTSQLPKTTISAATVKEGRIQLMRGEAFNFHFWVYAHQEQSRVLRGMLFDALSHNKSVQAAALISYMDKEALLALDRNGRTPFQWIIRYQDQVALEAWVKRKLDWGTDPFKEISSSLNPVMTELMIHHFIKHPNQMAYLIEDGAMIPFLHHPITHMLDHVPSHLTSQMANQVVEYSLMPMFQTRHHVEAFRWALEHGGVVPQNQKTQKYLHKKTDLLTIYEAHRLHALSAEVTHKVQRKPKRL